jgi:hypothetical protein
MHYGHGLRRRAAYSNVPELVRADRRDHPLRLGGRGVEESQRVIGRHARHPPARATGTGDDRNQTTTLTIRPGTTMTFLGSPVTCSATVASAAARTVASSASAATSTRPRTLPFTCTG